MERTFSREELSRVEAVDGFDWSTGFDDKSLPAWNEEVLSDLLGRGVVHRDCRLPPAHVASCLSHELAMNEFLDSGDPWGIILEDDVEYSPEARESGEKLGDLISFNEDCEMFYLCSEDHPGRRLLLQKDGQVQFPRTLMGYAISRKGAKCFLNALRPIVHLCDFQCPVRCFEVFTGYEYKWLPPDMSVLEKFRAYAKHTGGVIRHSGLAEVTTFSGNGRKEWMNKNERVT